MELGGPAGRNLGGRLDTEWTGSRENKILEDFGMLSTIQNDGVRPETGGGRRRVLKRAEVESAHSQK